MRKLLGAAVAALFLCLLPAPAAAINSDCSDNGAVWNAGTGTYQGHSGTGVAVWSWVGCNHYRYLAVGGQLWDLTLGQEVFDTGYNPYTWGTADVLEDPNSMTYEDYPCAPGHSYMDWVYGWVGGSYFQNEFVLGVVC